MTPNTPRQSATRHQQTHYDAAVTDTATDVRTPAHAAAVAAQERIEQGLQAAADGRDARDAAIVRMHVEDGLAATQIARLLDMSRSNVKLILDRAGYR
jgi:DNA-directed RNA polymerase specialized sigma24 family protein